MAELAALEAQEEGIEAAQIVVPPAEKISIGKAVAVLGGIGAVVWYLVFNKDSPFVEEKIDAKTEEKDRSIAILNTIKYGAMDDVPAEDHLVATNRQALKR